MKKKKILIILLLIFLILIFTLILFSIRLKGEKIVRTSYKDEYIDEGYKSAFKCNVESNYKNEVGTYEIIYSNFFFKKIRTIIVYDDVKPNLKLKGDSVMEINLGEKFVEPGFEAEDEVDGDLTDKVEIINGLDEKTVGSYKITYTVKDKSGNSKKQTRTINVIDNLYKNEYEKEDNTLIGWYTGNRQNNTRPRESELINLKNNNIYYLGKDEKVLYLTFDEGGNQTYLKEIVEILDEYNIKATFFLCKNYILNNKAFIKKMSDNGHSIGNHTVSHLSMPSLATSNKFDTFYNEIKENELILKDAIGRVPDKLFRYPMGEYSNRTIKIMKTLGYKSVFWSVAYKDWDQDYPKSYAYNNMVNQIHNGAVYLIHPKQVANYEALEDFIKYAIEEGYKFDLVKNI